MKFQNLLLLNNLLILSAMSAAAEIRYVNLNSASPTPPYTNWNTAATTIQDAVDAAVVGDQILVTNGVYQTGGRAVSGTMTNRVVVDKRVIVRSINGPQFTLIDGGRAVRCAYLTNGASLSGFTLTNGVADYGGGVWCETTSAVVSNCVLTGNYADYAGGGASGGTLNNCTLIGNSASSYGGGAFEGTLSNCTLSGKSASYGGGIADGEQSDGYFYLTHVLINCTLTGNSASWGGGAYGGTLNNCTLADNWASYGGGASGIGTYFHGYHPVTLNNCIVYYNTSPSGANCSGGTLSYCCTTPNPGRVGNITSAPLFVNQAGGNLRLQSNSPCINAGFNSYAPAGPDLDGCPRIVGGTVDIGAYEYQTPASVISYAWLQQYGLPTDGSVDSADLDHDGLNTWQEWRCLTDPTNPLSVLRLLTSSATSTNVAVRWQSVAGVNYFLERGTNLSGTVPFFTPLATDIIGDSGTTTFTDTTAVGPGPFFYRVGVQP